MSSILTLSMVYVVTSATIIGTAPSGLGVDKETYKDRNGEPVIPGSTVKGALRTAACYAARELGFTCCGSKKPDEMDRLHSSLGRNAVVVDGRRLCHVCAVFGAPGVASAVAVSDARPLGGAYRLGVRPGVEVDDYTLTARKARLYFYEIIESGSIFSGEIMVDIDILKSRGILCDSVKLLLKSLGYIEAVGIGHGLVKPFIVWAEHRGKKAMSPSEAAGLLPCSDLAPLFKALWSPEIIRLWEV